MILRLLRLAAPLSLLLATPATQVLLDRLYLAGTPAAAAAVSTHAVLLGAATLLFLLLGGTNLYGVVAITKLLHANRPADAAAFTQNTIGVASVSALLCALLVPFAGPLCAAFVAHPLDSETCDFARGLIGVVALLLVQNAALAPLLARRRVWSAVLVAAVGLGVHAALLAILLPEGGLVATALARSAGALVSTILALAILPVPGRFGLVPLVRLDQRVVREIVCGGLVIGLHALVGSLCVGCVFFLALSRNGADQLSAAAVAFGWYALFAAIPLGLAQATGIVTAEAVGQDDRKALHRVSQVGPRLCTVASAVIAVGFLAAGWTLLHRGGNGPQSALATAVLGVCAHAAFDGTTQCGAWSLRALGRQNDVLIATITTGLLYVIALGLFTDVNSRWVTLGCHGTVLAVVLQRKRTRSLPGSVVPARGGGGQTSSA
jgi:Na+-driven multidrug efflux pump